MSTDFPEKLSVDSKSYSPVEEYALYRGTIIDIFGSPTWEEINDHLRMIPDGALIVDSQGIIQYCGPYSVRPMLDNCVYHDVRPSYIVPGFIDTHIHFPQTFSVHSWAGGHLIRWLDECIFPAESKLADPQYAHLIAKAFVSQRINAGTTTAVVMGSAFPIAQDALFYYTQLAGLRMICGRGIQTCGPESAQALIFNEKTTVDLVVSEIEQWHNQGLLKVAIMPRFALSITEKTLDALAEVFHSYYDRGIYFHTHLSESKDDEIPAALATYNVTSYLDIFDNKLPTHRYRDSFISRRTIFAHGVYLLDDELARLSRAHASIAHCPNSQLFLGSGTMPWQKTRTSGVTIALGSDIGGGDQWVISQVANAAYKVHCGPRISHDSDPIFLSPAQLLYLCTLAGAIAVDQEQKIGNFDVGKDADFLIINPEQSPILAESFRHSLYIGSEKEVAMKELFTLLMGTTEKIITDVYVQGKKVTTLE